MIGKVFLLALLVAIASASPLALDSTTTDNYGVAISQFLAAWKQMIPCGYAAQWLGLCGAAAINISRRDIAMKFSPKI